MKEKLELIQREAIFKIEKAKTKEEIDKIKVEYLGKKGEITNILKSMKDLSAEEKPLMGKMVNEVRSLLDEKISTASEVIKAAELESKLRNEKIDVTMPGEMEKKGHLHPMNIVLNEIKDIFIGMGYKIAEGPEVDNDYYNFKALNIPENHPAKDEQDTFWIDKETVLRTQTSNIQVRTLEKEELPIKIIAPGRVYRSDEVDATHSPVFHQIEGMVVAEGINMGDLKGTLAFFAKKLFGDKTKIKFRPHHFPFTEPSAEVDVSCFKCGGDDKNCKICKGSGWIEILGCGMVHPNVLEMSGVDSEKYSGFAFGMGLERITMLKYGIEDLRLFFENDIRFLKQFK